MATDVKLGMVVGLGLVITVAVTYYSKGVVPPPARTGSVMPSLPAGTHLKPDGITRLGGASAQ